MSYLGRKSGRAALTSADIPDNSITSAKIVDAYDDNIQTNLAILAFRTATNASGIKFNLQDQVIDEYGDATGIDGTPSNQHELTAGVYRGEDPAGGTMTPTITHDADATGTTGDYSWYKWTDIGAGSFTTDTTQTMDYIVVAGGGSGGWSDQTGGGGGAGGFLTGTGLSVTAATHVITVGAGGAAITTKVQGLDGDPSSIASLVTTVGGGGGGGLNVRDGKDGGSGGGANGSGSPADAGEGEVGQGNDGGAFGSASGAHGSGGGGGAGAAGAAGTSSKAGDGGVGEDEVMGLNAADSYTFLGVASAGHEDGGARYFAGGGGGAWQGTDTGTALDGIGGLGGGGNGPKSIDTINYPDGGYGQDGTANTGGGGGAATYAGGSTSLSGAGGSGIVIIRRLTGIAAAGPGDLILQSTDTEAEAQPTKADMVILVQDAGSGVASLDTSSGNIKAYVSRDSGTTFTQGALVDEGDWGDDRRILAFHDLDISSQPADQTMCYKITTHSASAVYDTRIHATSMGWR